MAVFKSHLYNMNAYSPPLEGRDPSRYLLLDFNERTLPVDKVVQAALVDYIASGRMQMYPSYGDIVERVAEYAGVLPEQAMITNGSDQGIELTFRAVATAGGEAIIPAPNFPMYHQCAKIEGMKIVEPHYSKEHGFPVSEVLAAVNENTQIICVANPNNPCGAIVAREDILKIAAAAPHAAVLVDECYFEFSKATVVDCLEEYPNIVVTRTFSKTWGMPSLRFGYLMSAAKNVQALLTVRGPYDINQLAVVAAKAALGAPEETKAYVAEVMEKSKPYLEAFLTEKGIDFWPSQANFIWMFPSEASKIEQGLVQEGILVRPKQDFNGNLGLRVTLGTLEQTQRLVAVLASLLG